MRRIMNGGGVIQRALHQVRPRRAERRRSRAFIGIAVAVGALAALIFMRELPNLRRYLRIQQM